MSMLERWAPWYRALSEPAPFGDTTTYHLAAKFLADCKTVADWGSGKGWFKTLRPDCVAVDGTATPFTDVVADLRGYRSSADGVLLRHVLEHNDHWRDVLDNAAASASRKVCVVLFTPCGKQTRSLGWTLMGDVRIPDLSFALPDLFERLSDFAVKVQHLRTATQYGKETVLRCTRN